MPASSTPKPGSATHDEASKAKSLRERDNKQDEVEVMLAASKEEGRRIAARRERDAPRGLRPCPLRGANEMQERRRDDRREDPHVSQQSRGASRTSLCSDYQNHHGKNAAGACGENSQQGSKHCSGSHASRGGGRCDHNAGHSGGRLFEEEQDRSDRHAPLRRGDLSSSKRHSTPPRRGDRAPKARRQRSPSPRRPPSKERAKERRSRSHSLRRAGSHGISEEQQDATEAAPSPAATGSQGDCMLLQEGSPLSGAVEVSIGAHVEKVGESVMSAVRHSLDAAVQELRKSFKEMIEQGAAHVRSSTVPKEVHAEYRLAASRKKVHQQAEITRLTEVAKSWEDEAGKLKEELAKPHVLRNASTLKEEMVQVHQSALKGCHLVTMEQLGSIFASLKVKDGLGVVAQVENMVNAQLPDNSSLSEPLAALCTSLTEGAMRVVLEAYPEPIPPPSTAAKGLTVNPPMVGVGHGDSPATMEIEAPALLPEETAPQPTPRNPMEVVAPKESPSPTGGGFANEEVRPMEEPSAAGEDAAQPEEGDVKKDDVPAEVTMEAAPENAMREDAPQSDDAAFNEKPDFGEETADALPDAGSLAQEGILREMEDDDTDSDSSDTDEAMPALVPVGPSSGHCAHSDALP
jgi:hypothetical protein